jgi:serine protease Do
VWLGPFPDQATAAAGAEPDDATRLGMSLRDLTPQLAERLELPAGTRGVVVTDVEVGEVAEDAGLTRRDVIVSVNGQPVDGVASFSRAIDEARSDGRARLRVRRGDQFFVVVLRLK